MKKVTPRVGSQGLARYVAEQAGVSLMTVSRVFNGSDRVSEKTRQNVMNIANEVGYQPNMAARALRRGRSSVVGFLVAGETGLLGVYHSETLATFESHIAARGLTVSVMMPRGEESPMRTIRRLVASNAVGSLVVRFDQFPDPSDEDAALLQNLSVPIVFASAAPKWFLEANAVSSVCYNNHTGIEQAVEHLQALGHTRIGFISGTPGWMDSVEREEAFRAAMQRQSLAVDNSLVASGDFLAGYETSNTITRRFLTEVSHPPTAVICASDDLAAGALAAVRELGRRAPADLSVIGFNDEHWCRFLLPPLTSIRHSGRLLGHRLGEMLVEQLEEDEQLAPRHVQLETALVVRDSTAAPAVAAR